MYKLTETDGTLNHIPDTYIKDLNGFRKIPLATFINEDLHKLQVVSDYYNTLTLYTMLPFEEYDNGENRYVREDFWPIEIMDYVSVVSDKLIKEHETTVWNNTATANLNDLIKFINENTDMVHFKFELIDKPYTDDRVATQVAVFHRNIKNDTEHSGLITLSNDDERELIFKTIIDRLNNECSDDTIAYIYGIHATHIPYYKMENGVYLGTDANKYVWLRYFIK